MIDKIIIFGVHSKSKYWCSKNNIKLKKIFNSKM